MFKPLAGRIDSLPLVLAGPIVRRTEAGGVSVWIALRDARTITLKIGDLVTSPDAIPPLTTGVAATRRIGDKLHVVVVTALPGGLGAFAAGAVYTYNMEFDTNDDSMLNATPGSDSTLLTAGVVAENTTAAYQALTYKTETALAPIFPSFRLPPSQLIDLTLLYGSCRSPHGEGIDALATADRRLLDSILDPVAVHRASQLVLIGDQIYADDVSGTLLPLLMDASEALLGWLEVLPEPVATPGSFRFSLRQELVNNFAMFTSNARGHLLGFGEFCAMYLFALSPTLWPSELPDESEAFPAEYAVYVANPPYAGGAYGGERPFEALMKEAPVHRTRLTAFRNSLQQVRRALANVSTYMQFDDHEVGDDWYLTYDWCKGVLEAPLGRRIVQNGLAAQAIFQAWGNNPAQFAAGGKGDDLLSAIAAWDGDNPVAQATIELRVGVPAAADLIANRAIDKPHIPYGGPPAASDALDWHYRIAFSSHELIVLDTRTWRSFPGGPTDRCQLMSDAAIEAQITGTASLLTFVVLPTNFVGIPILERGWQRWVYMHYKHVTTAIWNALSLTRWGVQRSANLVYGNDVGDHWSAQTAAYERLLAKLAARGDGTRVVMLSGDVHMGFAARLHYQAPHPFGESAVFKMATFAHLSSSSLTQESGNTRGFGERGYQVLSNTLPDEERWVGWNSPVNPMPTSFNPDPWTDGDESVGNPAHAARFALWRPGVFLGRTPPMLLNPETTELDYVYGTLGFPNPRDWEYRITFILAEPAGNIDPPTPFDFRESLTEDEQAQWLGIAQAHRNHSTKWATGHEIVGKNNLGEITVEWGPIEADKKVKQRLWWRSALENPSTFIVSLGWAW